MATSQEIHVNHAHCEEIDEIRGTWQHHAHLLWWRVEEVNPQRPMFMALLLQSIWASRRPERGIELELEAKIRDREERSKEQIILMFAPAYWGNIWHTTNPSLSPIDILVLNHPFYQNKSHFLLPNSLHLNMPPPHTPNNNNYIIKLPNLCAGIDHHTYCIVLLDCVYHKTLMSMATGVHLYGILCYSCGAALCCCCGCYDTTTIIASILNHLLIWAVITMSLADVS